MVARKNQNIDIRYREFHKRKKGHTQCSLLLIAMGKKPASSTPKKNGKIGCIGCVSFVSYKFQDFCQWFCWKELLHFYWIFSRYLKRLAWKKLALQSFWKTSWFMCQQRWQGIFACLYKVCPQDTERKYIMWVHSRHIATLLLLLLLLRSSNKPEDDRYKRLNIISPDRPQKKSRPYSSPNLKSQEEFHSASQEINFSYAPETEKGKRAAKRPLVFKTDGRHQCQENLEVSAVSEMDLKMAT